MPQPLLEPQLVHVLAAHGGEAGVLHLPAENALADGIGREGEQAGIVVALPLGVVFIGGGVYGIVVVGGSWRVGREVLVGGLIVGVLLFGNVLRFLQGCFVMFE